MFAHEHFHNFIVYSYHALAFASNSQRSFTFSNIHHYRFVWLACERVSSWTNEER